MVSLLLDGLRTTFSPGIFPFLVIGVTGGIVIGALPGLTATMGVAVLLPLTFGMESTPAGPSQPFCSRLPEPRRRLPRFSTGTSLPERERLPGPCPFPPSPPSPAEW
jgi:hypothetical protein